MRTTLNIIAWIVVIYFLFLHSIPHDLTLVIQTVEKSDTPYCEARTTTVVEYPNGATTRLCGTWGAPGDTLHFPIPKKLP